MDGLFHLAVTRTQENIYADQRDYGCEYIKLSLFTCK